MSKTTESVKKKLKNFHEDLELLPADEELYISLDEVYALDDESVEQLPLEVIKEEVIFDGNCNFIGIADTSSWKTEKEFLKEETSNE